MNDKGMEYYNKIEVCSVCGHDETEIIPTCTCKCHITGKLTEVVTEKDMRQYN